MTLIAIIAYTLIPFSGVTLLYIGLVALEVGHGNRVASEIRLYLDQKILAAVRKVFACKEAVSHRYSQGNSMLGGTIAEVIPASVARTQKKMYILKTGRVEVSKGYEKNVRRTCRRCLRKRRGDCREVIQHHPRTHRHIQRLLPPAHRQEHAERHPLKRLLSNPLNLIAEYKQRIINSQLGVRHRVRCLLHHNRRVCRIRGNRLRCGGIRTPRHHPPPRQARSCATFHSPAPYGQ